MKRCTIRLGILTLLTCVIGGYFYYQSDFELKNGLDTLFFLRGPRKPPSEVVIVTMDDKSEDDLNVSFADYTAWRTMHSKAIQTLTAQGAALIIFDLNFIRSQPKDDSALAQAMSTAGNVLATECVTKQSIWEFSGREQCSKVNSKRIQGLKAGRIEMLNYPPTPELARALIDHAPFFLSDDASTQIVREVWTAISRFNETPTLPVVVWLHYLKQKYSLSTTPPPQTPLSSWFAAVRKHCLISPEDEVKIKLAHSAPLQAQLRRLVCAPDDTQYLDFYGPPKTFRMESYSDVVQGKVNNLSGKVVFIGKVNQLTGGDIQDVFRTPFTNNQSGQMYGVEIMATQFANLLEHRQVNSPMPPIVFLLTFSLVNGFLLCLFPGITGILASLALSAGYLGLACWAFSHDALWLPVAVPLLLQLPLAWLLTLLWSHRDLQAEIQRILDFVRRVFPDWLPVISGINGKLKIDLNESNYGMERNVHGLCLATDIEDYTKIAAHRPPQQLLTLLKEYYKVLAQPVKDRKGHIADVAGDAMIAFWIFDTVTVNDLRLSATRAALDMQAAVANFNSTHETTRLPTRIGLHEGDMALGELNAAGSSQYRAIGDTVNAASRIQGVNKYLGTQILASATIAADLNDIVYRSVGRFLLVGLGEPIELIEIFSQETYQIIVKTDLLARFALGLDKFQQQAWQEAIEHFQYILDTYGHDGPTRFYLDLALTYRTNPPPENRDFIQFSNK